MAFRRKVPQETDPFQSTAADKSAPASQGIPRGEAAAVPLIHRWQQGDESAFVALYHTYVDRLLTAVRQKIAEDLQGKIDPSDIVQSAFASAVRTAGEFEFDNDQDFFCLLFGIATKKRLEKLRRKSTTEVADDAVGGRQSDPLLPAADEVVAAQEAGQVLWGALSDRERSYLELRLQGFDKQEIARDLGLSSKSIQRVALAVEIKAHQLFPKDQEIQRLFRDSQDRRGITPADDPQ